MKSKRSSFTAHRLRIKIEGFQIDRFISECVARKIKLRDIKFINNLEAIMTIADYDFNQIKNIAKQKYRITVLSEAGYRYNIAVLIGKKALLAGIAIFFIIIYYQSMFVSEVRVYGYERFTEAQVREVLKEAGIHEGARKIKNKDEIQDIKLRLYDELDPLAFVEIQYKGSLAEVTIVEGNNIRKQVPSNQPCDVVADKEGYIYKVIAREGLGAVKEGDYVVPGQVLISGYVPIKYSTYGDMDKNEGKYVHAEGEVTIKSPHRFSFLITPNMVVSTAGKDTLPVERQKGETDHDLVKRSADKMIRRYIKEKSMNNAYITNKDLNFTVKENIIEVNVLFEAVEKIGIEQEIMNGI